MLFFLCFFSIFLSFYTPIKSIEPFEKNGKLYIELESEKENIEFLIDIRAEYDSDLYKSINDIYDIVNVEVID